MICVSPGSARPRRISVPTALRQGPSNRELEALAFVPVPRWGICRNFWTQYRRQGQYSWLGVWEPASVFQFRVARSGDFAVTDIAVLPDGDHPPGTKFLAQLVLNALRPGQLGGYQTGCDRCSDRDFRRGGSRAIQSTTWKVLRSMSQPTARRGSPSCRMTISTGHFKTPSCCSLPCVTEATALAVVFLLQKPQRRGVPCHRPPCRSAHAANPTRTGP